MNPTDKLLQDANRLGTEASKQTGVTFKPITPTTTSSVQNLVNTPIDVTRLKPSTSTYNLPTTSMPNQTGVSVNALANKEPIQTPTEVKTPDKAQALMDKLLATDVATQKADLREKADLQAKNQEYNTALADYKNRKTAYEDQIEEIRKNPQGKFGGAVEAEVQELQRKANKDLANMAVGVELLQNNYLGAEKILNDQIADIQTSYENDVKKFQLGMDFLRNDMTQSEVLKANQAFEEKQMKAKFDLDEINAQKDFIRQKSLLSYKAGLDNKPSPVNTLSNEINKIFENKEANTPVIAKTVLSQLVGDKSIAAGTRARIAPAVEVLNSLDELANSNLEGKFAGMGGFLGFAKLKEGVKGIFNKKSQEAITNQQQIDAINLKVQQWASGASLTKQQTDQVNKMTPNSWDSDRTIRAKTSQLYNFMLNQAEGNLMTEGINVQFPSVNLFEIQDLYEKASPEQKKVIEQTYFNKK